MSDCTIDHRIDVYGSALERNSEGRFGDHSQIADSGIKNSCARENDKW